ncbi:MAG: carboxypeptidase regulatory-like domain-containing protein [Bryobacterales bacterium]|nr:carboxypeptidase regulatory-like domain-containing protein [Bryobacterales bacterium]
MSIRSVAACVFLVLLLAVTGPAWAQMVSGRVSGSVVDASGAAVAGANVALLNERTGEQMERQTNDSGYFVFPLVPPSSYAITVSSTGFAIYERRGMVLNANASLALGSLPLQVGSMSERVEVVAEGSMVELDTTGQSQVVTSQQLDKLMSISRDVMSTMSILPGVSQQRFGSNHSIGGSISGAETQNFSGTRAKWNSVKLDGQPGQNVDQINRFSIPVAWDAVEEITVQPTSYLAEHGRSSGVHINVISKSGTNEFHGSLYHYKRHEQFNANNFFNNREGLSKPLGRYNTYGGTVGGPIKRDKLFFFVSQENWSVTQTGPITRATLPTALERQGNFSETLEQNGRLIPIFDPLTQAPIPNNIIPVAQRDSNGLAMLNVMPLPNSPQFFSTLGFNNIMQQRIEIPKKQTQLKFDWLPTSNDRLSYRPRWFDQDLRGQTGVCCSVNANFDLQPHHYNFGNVAHLATWTRTLTPTMVNEVSGGWFKSYELGNLTDRFDLSRYRRDNNNLQDLPQLFPQVNEFNLIPAMQYGGVPNSPSLTYDDRTPIDARDDRLNFSNTLSWLKGNHNLKFGGYVEIQYASEGPRLDGAADAGGRFIFNRDRNNPFDTNHPFSNAAYGTYREYRQSSNKSNGRGIMWLQEYFAQDSWKVNRRLSLDFGFRFSKFTDFRLRTDEGAALALPEWNIANIPAYFVPAINPATNQRVARNPITGALAPSPLIGTFVPGVGDRLNGMVVGGFDRLNGGYRQNAPLQFSPRFGMALDLLGNGKTVVRGGFGVYRQGIFASGQSVINSNVVTAAPVVESPSIFFNTIDGIRNAPNVFAPPNAVSTFEEAWRKVPTVYKWSFGIQQQLPWNTLMDVAYVANTGRHLRQNANVNTLPPGARFQQSALDPTTNRPLPDNFIRPYFGFANIIQQGLDVGWSNYNALQVSVNRRYTSRFQYGLAYTWSKTMSLTDDDANGLPIYRGYREYLYGKAGFDQTHVLVLNYLYSVPNFNLLGNNAVSKTVLHGWNVSGISTFASGFPQPITFSYADGVDRWGGGDAVRVNMVQNPILPRSERTLQRWFNTASVAAPGFGDFGNAPLDVIRGPGQANFDFSLQKQFAIRERTRLEFRWEMFSMFNHTQFDDVDRAARFDAQGNQINTRFGQVITAKTPREMQFALRFQF